MKTNSYHVLGVMSGTSLDGLDLCYAHFEFDQKWKFKIIASETLGYSKEWTLRLSSAVDLRSSELTQLDIEYTDFLADKIDFFIKKHNIVNLDAICSHGHTVLHQPENQLTYQIGNLELLSKRLKKTVVCDFRTQDVKLGGQGAPLVPIGDELLFHEFDICLNLGGFANLSYEYNGMRLAYDVCPVNIILNTYANKLGSKYDDQGNFARSGTINLQLLEQLNALSYYEEPAPKSLGLEWVKSNILPLLEKNQNSNIDVLRTLVEHMAIQISKSLNEKTKPRILVSGGGAYNSFLIERLKALVKGEIIIPSTDIIDFKEALVFALLGVLRIRNEVNCLQTVTGAQRDHSSGVIFKG
ncbi:MAG: anhydro-N-acetylmuramic acid kinase [Bacteroidia bacterium]|nr:anhydro-N-acetylmuramic acid kinase [Bacteroidia bacterium]